jgi:hypothetical protein
MSQYELNDERIETIRNYEKPYEPVEFQEKLTELGGRIGAAGEFTGKPQLIIVWGPEFLMTRCGKLRPVFTTGHFIERGVARFGLVDPKTREVKRVSEKVFKKVARRHPERVAVLRKQTEHEWIGRPRWFILQYIPEHLIQDNPFDWELERHDWWFNPDTRRTEWTDMIGPYPYDGRYEFFIEVCTESGEFRDLDEGVLSFISYALQQREKYRQTQTDEEAVNQIIEDAELARQKLAQEVSEALEDEIKGPIARAILQLPFVSARSGRAELQNLMTKHGRASEKITINKDGQKEVLKINDKRRVG